eukprot:13344974-Ditylum_brightwellii.AAC.1
MVRLFSKRFSTKSQGEKPSKPTSKIAFEDDGNRTVLSEITFDSSAVSGKSSSEGRDDSVGQRS